MSDSTINPGDEGLMAGRLAAQQARQRSIARALGLMDINRGDMLGVGLVYLLSLFMICYPFYTFISALRNNTLLLSLPLLLIFLAGFFGLQVAQRWTESGTPDTRRE